MRKWGTWMDASRTVSQKYYDLSERITIGGAVGLALSGGVLAVGLIMERLSSESLLFKDTVFYYDDADQEKNEKAGFVPKDVDK